MRTIQGIDKHLKPIDVIISNTFLPTLFIVNDNEPTLFQLPVRLGGLGMHILLAVASENF